jgi:hypothetical protein
MLKSFSLARFRVILEPEDRLVLHPKNPSNTLRGAFGATFKRLVCATPWDCRATCRLKDSCPYGQIFEPSPPPGTDRLRLNQDIPRPFILRLSSQPQPAAEPGRPLSFDLHLIGFAIDYLPYFLVTFRELGQQGIGIGRGRFEISRVLALHPTPSSLRGGEHAGHTDIYSPKEHLVRVPAERLTFEDCRRLAAERVTTNGDRITIRFLTPTYLKVGGQLVAHPDFHHVVKRLRDRVNALAHFYCDDRLDIDYKAFGQRAEAVRTVRCDVRWEDRERRSWKTGHRHEMGGFVGEVTYEGELDEFLPLLMLGQFTHVGKYTVWGNGQYEIL